MAKNDATVKRVSRKRTTAGKTARKPRLAESAATELQVETTASEPIEAPPIVEVAQSILVEAAPSPAEPAPSTAIESPGPARAPAEPVAVLPPAAERRRLSRDARRLRRIALVRALLRRIRREAERRGRPVARRLAARFPLLAEIGDTLRRWF